MRKSAWSEVETTEPDRAGAAGGYARRARRAVPGLVIAGVLVTAGLYALSLLMAGTSTTWLDGFRSHSSDQVSFVSSAVEHLRGWVSQVRSGIDGAMPFGPLATILKLAVCAVAATLLLRGPRGT